MGFVLGEASRILLVHFSIAGSISVLLSLGCLQTDGGVESTWWDLSHLACFIDGLGLNGIWIEFADIFAIIGMWSMGVNG